MKGPYIPRGLGLVSGCFRVMMFTASSGACIVRSLTMR